MSWYSVPRVTASTYHSYGLHRRPWAVVRDADGFSAEAINGYLQYAAWQDAPPGRVRSDARGLAAAAAWLETIGRPWATADLDIWATYCEDLMSQLVPSFYLHRPLLWLAEPCTPPPSRKMQGGISGFDEKQAIIFHQALTVLRSTCLDLTRTHGYG